MGWDCAGCWCFCSPLTSADGWRGVDEVWNGQPGRRYDVTCGPDAGGQGRAGMRLRGGGRAYRSVRLADRLPSRHPHLCPPQVLKQHNAIPEAPKA